MLCAKQYSIYISEHEHQLISCEKNIPTFQTVTVKDLDTLLMDLDTGNNLNSEIFALRLYLRMQTASQQIVQKSQRPIRCPAFDAGLVQRHSSAGCAPPHPGAYRALLQKAPSSAARFHTNTF